MSGPIIMLVLGAALLHATWNIIVKGGANKLFEASMNVLGEGLGAIFFLPFLPLPAPEAWGLLALSCVFHTTYSLCLAAAYQHTDLTVGYTLMRGTAPMLTAIALFLFGVPLGLAGWAGVVLLCAGIFSLALEQKLKRKGNLKGVIYALRTSFVIMAYTLADGYGARLSGNGPSYACWLFVIDVFPLHCYIMARHGRAYLAYLRERGRIGLTGGLCGLGSYGIVIWAMTVAPIAIVAALRETSVIFGMLMAVMFLGEKLTPLRIAAIFLVVAGAMTIRLG